MIRVGHISRYLRPRELKLAICQYQTDDLSIFHLGEEEDRIQGLMYIFDIHIVSGKRLSRADFHVALRALELRAHVDLFQCHNEPDYFVPLVKEVLDAPVIYDVHDLNSVRTGCTRTDEALSFEKCDGVLTVGGPMETVCRIKCGRSVPVGSYRTLCPKVWFPSLRDPVENTVVIGTGLVNKPGHYRNWAGCLEALMVQGFDVSCYSGFYEIPEGYKDKPYVHPAIPIPKLLERYAYAEVGICGAPYPNPLIEIANPNKVYEYVAAGIPTICFGTSTYMARVIHQHNLGLSIDDPDDFEDAVAEIRHRKIRENIREIRDQFSMECEIPGVLAFYKEVLHL